MIVYRIEHRSILDERTNHLCGPLADMERFDGPYRDAAYIAQNVVCDVMNGRMDKPTPWWDLRLNGIAPNEICGVDSKESLNFWFEYSIPFLEKAGFVVNKYDVPDKYVRHGESGQVVFQYKHATLVNNKKETVK